MITNNYLKIPILLITIGLLTSCSYDNDLNDWKLDGLNGKVKSFLQLNYKAEKKFGEWDKGDINDYGHLRVSFDNDGNYQLIEDLNENNGLMHKRIFKRENGVLIGYDTYLTDGELRSKLKYIHKSKDEKEYIIYNYDGKKIGQGKLYYANNRLIKELYQRVIDDKIEKEYTTVWEYDQDDILVSHKTDLKGEIIDNCKYECVAFDEHNNWTKRLCYHSKESEEPEYIQIREYKYY